MINVIDKMNNLGIISRIVSHRFAKRIASKTQMNDIYLLLSGLSGIIPSADAKMYLTLPSMDGDGRKVTSTQQQQYFDNLDAYTRSIQDLPRTGKMQLQNKLSL